MANRDASVRLTLNAQSFIGGIREVGNKVESIGNKMAKALGEPLKAGFKAGRDEAGKMADEIKGALKAAMTLGGALGGGAMIKGAVDLQSAFGRISFQIQNATGELMSLDKIQSAVATGASKTSRTQQELAEALAVMMDRGASPEFALASLESVGQAMNATGMDAERTGRSLAALSRMYGMTGAEGSKSLDGIMLAASKGGIQVEELFEDFTEFGSLAQGAGLKGKKGFDIMLAMISNVGPRVNGTTSEISSGIDILFERMRNVVEIQGAFKAGGAKMNVGEFTKLDNVIDQAKFLMKAGPKVMEAFKSGFTGREEKAAFDSLLGPYFETLNNELKAGKSETEANAAAMVAVERGVADMGKPFQDAGRVAEASARSQKSTAAKLREAQNKMLEAFTDPKTMAAIDSIAEKMPKLAEALAKLVSFTVDNPMLAGGLYAGGRIGGASAMGFAGDAGKSLVVSGGKKIGSDIAASFAADVASKGKWGAIGKNVGAAAGIAIAAYVAYELGKKAIDATMGESIKSEDDLRTARFKATSVAKTGTVEEKRAALATLKGKIAESEKDGPGVINTVFGGLAHAVTGGDVKTAGQRHEDTMAMARADARALEESLNNGGQAVGDALLKGAAALNNAAARLNAGGGSAGSNGLPPAPPSGAGAGG